VSPGVLSGPKHIGLGCDSLSPREVEMGPDGLCGPKHAGSSILKVRNRFRCAMWTKVCWARTWKPEPTWVLGCTLMLGVHPV